MSETASPKSESDYPEIDPVKRRASRIKLLTILAVFAVPLILATIYLQVVRLSGGQVGDTSRGQLIKPAVPLTEFSLQASDEVLELESLYGIWTMLYMPEGECLDACRMSLYNMRQVRLALNQRMDRVQRVVLAESAEQLDEALQAEHLGLIVATGSPAEQAVLKDQVRAAESAMESSTGAIYLLDPFGNVMLRFPADLPPESMLKDIKHLLKVSRIG
ncbi:SCO family protein [Granulosicoccus sp. 3-233]|uniref:SCO family protein n=1 Tax=Granulosicoccus sp. 3-233 TaxID=3417969 RepID=UPI003D3404D1